MYTKLAECQTLKFKFCNCTSSFRTIMFAFTEKNWTLSSVKLIHKRTTVSGSATKCKTGSGRPETARTVDVCMALRVPFVVCDAFNVLSCSHCSQACSLLQGFELR